MARLLMIFSRFHISVAMVLATIAYLAVPENAFADDPKVCAANCETTFGIDNPHYWNCVAGCCNTDDPGDPNCCSELCDPADPDCVTNCSAMLTTLCEKGDCELSISDPKNCHLQKASNCAAGGCVTTGAKCSTACSCLFSVGSSVPCWCQL